MHSKACRTVDRFSKTETGTAAVCTTMTKYKDRHGSETVCMRSRKHPSGSTQNGLVLGCTFHLELGVRLGSCPVGLRTEGFRVTLETCTWGTGSTDNFE